MAKDFKGHFEPADPRNVIWGAGGCSWPTVPPYRLRLGSEAAQAPWGLLKTNGILYQARVGSTHDDVTWDSISNLPPFLDASWVWKHYDRQAQDIRWTVFFNNPGVAYSWEITQLIPAPQRCNDTVELDNWEWSYPYPSPGSPLTLWQVYFNETQPPEGWPPWA